MKIIAAIEVDLDDTPLGTRSRLGEMLCGQVVLARTVERVLRAGELAGVWVACPAQQLDRCRELLGGRQVNYWPHAPAAPPHRALVRAARKWSLDGWRGGLGGACSMDEYTDCRVLAESAKAESADGVLAVPGASAVVDPVILDGLVHQFREVSEEVRMTFCQAPPGLAGVVYATNILEEMASKRIPPGWILTYKPDAPAADLIFKPCCFNTPQAVRHAVGRLLADTDSAVERLTNLLTAHADPDANTIGRFLIERERSYVPALPREVELELTTADPYPDTPHRPRGSRVGQRGPIDLAMIRKVADDWAGGRLGRRVSRDDTLIVLGGFGDPILHPGFAEALAILRAAGVYGLAVRTAAVDLTEPIRAALIEHRVDVLEVLLDAWTQETYAHVTASPAASLADVVANLEALGRERDARGWPCPIILPVMTKCRANVSELDDFYDGWIRKLGCANVVGFNAYSSRLEDLSVINMSPPTRTPCRRIMSRCTILADGRMTICDQDHAGEHTIGSIADQSLHDLWNAPAMQGIRQRHLAGDSAAMPLCANCSEWHRP